MMTKEALYKNLKRMDVVVLNVLTEEEYLKLHIQGSQNMPLFQVSGKFFSDEVEKKYGKKKLFITYGSDVTCAAGQNAAQSLKNRGLLAQPYLGGIKEWQEAGLPVEGTQVKQPAHSH